MATNKGVIVEILTDAEMEMARRIGRKVASKWSAAEQDDVTSELYLWLVEHKDVVTRYRDDPYGEQKLFVALRRRASKYAYREQVVRAGGRLAEDDSPYTLEQIERALPYIFEDIPQTVAYEHPETGASNYRGEPNRALDLILDLRMAVADLPEPVRETIVLRFRDGLTNKQIGDLTGVSQEAARKRVHSSVRRVKESLTSSE
jgi:RNA polymerase sigma factor (sigma-70 family)